MNDTTRVTPHPFLDSVAAADITVVDRVTDSEGREWLIVEETRLALVRADGFESFRPGDVGFIRLDAAEAFQ